MKLSGVILVTALCLCAAARADDPCDGFAWDVTAERALFAQAAEIVALGADAGSAVVMVLATPYRAVLLGEDKVHFVRAPGKKSARDGAQAGLARVRVGHAGRYRMSLDAPAWIDVVVDGSIIPSRAFQGRVGCRTRLSNSSCRPPKC